MIEVWLAASLAVGSNSPEPVLPCSIVRSVAPAPKRLRRVLLAGAAMLLATVALVVMVPDLRVRAGAAALLRIPRLLPAPVEQEIGFARSADGIRIA